MCLLNSGFHPFPLLKRQITLGSCCKTELAARFEQIHEHEQGLKLTCVFLKSAISRLHVTPLAFEDLERVLDLGTDGGEFLIAFLLAASERMVSPSFVEDAPEDSRASRFAFVCIAHIALVAEDCLFFPMEEFLHLCLVMNLGR